MTAIEPELWAERPRAAVACYAAAFAASVLHLVGDGEDIVARLAVGEARFWVASAGPEAGRFSPRAIGGSTSRTLLIVGNPAAVVDRAVDAGAVATARVGEEHGWLVGRIVDPFGHEWEIGRPPAP